MTGRLRVAFFLTLVILAVEVGGGLISHSLALLSDAGHVLTDLFALGLAWFAAVQASRPADARKTFGYHRTGILAALANAVTLILVVVAISYEALHRFQRPEAVEPRFMFISAAVGIGANLYIAFGLRGEAGENLNVRAAVLHVVGDIAASVGVVIGGGVILLTGWLAADPLISIAIAVLIARGAWQILRETTDVLMEGTPRNLNMVELVRDVVREPGVRDVHDLHVWSVGGGINLLSAHVQLDGNPPLVECCALSNRLAAVLKEHHRIPHATLQFEATACEPSLYCSMEPATPAGQRGHDHPHR